MEQCINAMEECISDKARDFNDQLQMVSHYLNVFVRKVSSLEVAKLHVNKIHWTVQQTEENVKNTEIESTFARLHVQKAKYVADLNKAIAKGACASVVFKPEEVEAVYTVEKSFEEPVRIVIVNHSYGRTNTVKTVKMGYVFNVEGDLKTEVMFFLGAVCNYTAKAIALCYGSEKPVYQCRVDGITKQTKSDQENLGEVRE